MKPIPLTETQMAELFRLRKEIAELKRQRDELAAVIGKALHWTSVEGVSLFSRYSMVVDTLRAALAHDDTALKEYHDSIVEKCAVIAGNACLVPPDGGTPTEEEAAVSEEAAHRIRNLKSTSVPAGYTEEELERDNPYNQWMHE